LGACRFRWNAIVDLLEKRVERLGQFAFSSGLVIAEFNAGLTWGVTSVLVIKGSSGIWFIGWLADGYKNQGY
jgi:hypothetical protein